MRGAVERVGIVDPAAIDEVLMGNVVSAGWGRTSPGSARCVGYRRSKSKGVDRERGRPCEAMPTVMRGSAPPNPTSAGDREVGNLHSTVRATELTGCRNGL